MQSLRAYKGMRVALPLEGGWGGLEFEMFELCKKATYL